MKEYIIKSTDIWAIDCESESLFKDREEIVRCRDCKYFRTGINYDVCAFTDKYTRRDGFCSWAELKIEEKGKGNDGE